MGKRSNRRRQKWDEGGHWEGFASCVYNPKGVPTPGPLVPPQKLGTYRIHDQDGDPVVAIVTEITDSAVTLVYRDGATEDVSPEDFLSMTPQFLW